MCDEAVDICGILFDCVIDQYITQEMCDKVPPKRRFMLTYCHDGYKSPEICDKAVESYLQTLKSVPDWFITSKTFKKLDNVVFSNDEIILGDIDSIVITLLFFSNEIGFNSVNFNNVNLDEDNFDNFDPEIINNVIVIVCCNRYKQQKMCKKR